MNYRESIDWLFSTQLFGIKLGLEGPRCLLKECLAFPRHGVRVIHVAGTNGKGSTCAMIDSVARATGVRTGLFTSPHLIDFRERIKVLGQEIPEEKCALLLTEVREVCEAMETHPTFFEIALTVAMRWFRERECEMIVLETGMGGRLDATTAVPADVCAITPVALDHMQWLGDTLEKIAYEKAGILVEGKPVVSAPQSPEVVRVLKKEANEMRSPLSFVEAPLSGYPVALPGVHQLWNAALALECLHAAEVRLDYDAVRHGLSSVVWPGRFEVVTRGDRKIVLDGAHNVESAAALVAAWRERFGARRCSLVFSAVEEKEVAAIAGELLQVAERVHVCPVDTPRAVGVDGLKSVLPGELAVEGHADAVTAVEAALGDGLPVLVAGSLFLIGEVKAWLEGGAFQSSSQ